MPNAALQVPGPFCTVCELRATDKQQSQLGPPPLMSSLTRKVGSKPDVRVNDLPGPPQTTDLEPPDINAELQQWTRCAAVQYLSNVIKRRAALISSFVKESRRAAM